MNTADSVIVAAVHIENFVHPDIGIIGVILLVDKFFFFLLDDIVNIGHQREKRYFLPVLFKGAANHFLFEQRVLFGFAYGNTVRVVLVEQLNCASVIDNRLNSIAILFAACEGQHIFDVLRKRTAACLGVLAEKSDYSRKLIANVIAVDTDTDNLVADDFLHIIDFGVEAQLLGLLQITVVNEVARDYDYRDYNRAEQSLSQKK